MVILNADATKGAQSMAERAVQTHTTAAQSQNRPFGLILATVGLNGVSDEGLGGSGDEPENSPRGDEGGRRDPAVDGAVAAVIAASVGQGVGGLLEFEAGSIDGAAYDALSGAAAGSKSSSRDESVQGSVAEGTAALPDSLQASGFADAGGAGALNSSAATLLAGVHGGFGQLGQQQGSGPLSDRNSEAAATLVSAFLSGASVRSAVSLAETSAPLSSAEPLIQDLQRIKALFPQVADFKVFFNPLGEEANASSTVSRTSGFGIGVDLLSSNPAVRVDPNRGTLVNNLLIDTFRTAEDPGEPGRAVVASDAELPTRFTEAFRRELQARSQPDPLAGQATVLIPSAADPLNSVPQVPASASLSKEAQANSAALEGSVIWLASQHGGSASIDLSPPELGPLRIDLKVDATGTGATLVVHAASDAARLAVEQALDRLYESFQNSGLTLSVYVGSGSPNPGGFPFGTGSQGQGAERFPAGPVAASSSEPQAVGVPTAGSGSDMLSLYA